jgi:hypothetical protein
MTTSKIDFTRVNAAALAALPAILARILPSGKPVHKEWIALNPRRVDRSLGSFKVNRFNCKWADFATGDKGGDPVSLVAYIEGVSQVETARLLARMLGIDLGGNSQQTRTPTRINLLPFRLGLLVRLRPRRCGRKVILANGLAGSG